MRSLFPPGCLALAFIIFLFLLLPFFLADVLLTALGKLGLSPAVSMLAAAGIFLGSVINIPVHYIEKPEMKSLAGRGMYGLERMLFRNMHKPDKVLLAVNLGGCVIPFLISVYELVRLWESGLAIFISSLACIGINIFICERLAQPVPDMGITIPALVPALVAALSALFLVPDQAPAAAFVSGVLGTLVGADLLHLKDIGRISSGIASIGGAGTFDGIVISGIFATLLA
ncbi:MAG: DUF1614 domain-containing protein [Balneolaceae bacterium]|nr:DUF1614 domain-containing protein [Balneolaceae bacterium]